MNKLFIAASAAALLTAAGTVPSLAQSSTSGASSMTMPSITCRDLSSMDQQTARNVVFYLGGLNAASSSSSTMNSTTGSGSSASGSGSPSTTGSSDTSGSTTADAGSSGATGSSGSSDTTGSTTAAGSSGTSGSASAGGAVMAQLPGFSMINADQILSTCQSQPDMQLSTILGTSATAQ